MKEAAKLGFAAAVAPPGGSDEAAGLRVERTDHIADVVARIATLPGGRKAERRADDERRPGPPRRAAQPAADDEDEETGGRALLSRAAFSCHPAPESC